MARVKQEYQRGLTEFSASHREEVRLVVAEMAFKLKHYIPNSLGNEADVKQDILKDCRTDGFCPRESLHRQRQPRLELEKKYNYSTI